MTAKFDNGSIAAENNEIPPMPRVDWFWNDRASMMLIVLLAEFTVRIELVCGLYAIEKGLIPTCTVETELVIGLKVTKALESLSVA